MPTVRHNLDCVYHNLYDPDYGGCSPLWSLHELLVSPQEAGRSLAVKHSITSPLSGLCPTYMILMMAAAHLWGRFISPSSVCRKLGGPSPARRCRQTPSAASWIKETVSRDQSVPNCFWTPITKLHFLILLFSNDCKTRFITHLYLFTIFYYIIIVYVLYVQSVQYLIWQLVAGGCGEQYNQDRCLID